MCQLVILIEERRPIRWPKYFSKVKSLSSSYKISCPCQSVSSTVSIKRPCQLYLKSLPDTLALYKPKLPFLGFCLCWDITQYLMMRLDSIDVPLHRDLFPVEPQRCCCCISSSPCQPEWTDWFFWEKNLKIWFSNNLNGLGFFGNSLVNLFF